MTVSGEPKSRKLHASLLVLLLVLFFMVYNRKFIARQMGVQTVTAPYNTQRTQAAISWNRAQIDSAHLRANDGDLVVRTGNDEVSDIFRRLNTHDATFSHIGIVFIENGTPMVYNIIGGADNPDGYIRRDSLTSFITPKKNTGFGVYRLPLTRAQKSLLRDNTVRYFTEKRSFDINFNLSTDSLLYCTEFVYKVVTETVKKKDYFEKTHNEVLDFDYIAVDNLLMHPKIKMICKVRYKQ